MRSPGSPTNRATQLSRSAQREDEGHAGALLQVRDIEAHYGSSQALFGVSFDVHAGELVTLIGRNGMGKSTTVKTVMGMMAPRAGTIRFADASIEGRPSYQVARAGLGLVPEGRQIFPNLSVRENLVATARGRTGDRPPWTLERVYAMFPRLEQRSTNPGGNLSGGEQQMLAIGRALMTNPQLLILDEATEGLAPLLRSEVWRCLEGLKAAGLSLVVIDKNLGPLLRLADRHYILEKGRVVWSGTSAELRAQKDALHAYIGV
jgi:branched-chain amino acid transport system ATP-binding protein